MGNRGYSGSPTADFFPTTDGWIALGANTPRQLLRLLEVLELSELAADPTYFAEPLDAESPTTFVRSRDPAALKTIIAQRLQMLRADELEERLATRGVPAAKVRKLGEFAEAALGHGRISTVTLRDGDTEVMSPGLGFGARRHPG